MTHQSRQVLERLRCTWPPSIRISSRDVSQGFGLCTQPLAALTHKYRLIILFLCLDSTFILLNLAKARNE